MRFFAIPLLGFAAVTLASSSVFTESFCLTVQGSQSLASVPRTTIGNTKSFTVTAKSTSSQTSTVTPAPVTTTTTVYTTKTLTVTAPVNTDTFSSTTTLYTTSTSIIIIAGGSTTVTSTSTSTQQDTTTISISAGFTPIQSQIKSSDYTTWSARPAKREAATGYNRWERRAPVPASKSAKPTSTLYPSQVTCLQFVQVLTTGTSIISATKTKTTTLKPVTTTKTSTSTIVTTTTTTLKSASTTVVSTYISSISTTTTSTSSYTSTVVDSTTVVGPTVSSFAVCNDPGNYLHKIQGVPIADLFNGNFDKFQQLPDIEDEVSCCNACQLAGPQLCTVSAFEPRRGCVFLGLNDATCRPENIIDAFHTNFGGEHYVVMNGNCGRYEYDFANSYGPYAGCEPGTGIGCACGPGTDTDC